MYYAVMLRIFSIQSLFDDTDFTMSFFLVLNFERHRSGGK